MKQIKSVLSALMAVGLMFVGAAQGEMIARAEEKTEEANSPILTITPTQKGFGTMEPGKSYTETFNVRNSGSGMLAYTVEITPYSVETESYAPNYTKETQYTDIKNWITVNKTEGTVEAGKDDPIVFTVNVPEDVHGGAQAAVIMINTNDVSDGTIKAAQRLGYLVYGNIDGELVQTAKILENKIPGFMFVPPVKATSAVENTGNVYTPAVYTFEVFAPFNDNPVFSNADRPDKEIVFPETRRNFEIKWEASPKLGLFRVRQTVKIFDQESKVEKWVFICPMWFLVTIIALVGVMIFWVVQRARKRK